MDLILPAKGKICMLGMEAREVTVRIWKKDFPSASFAPSISVGHVSLQTHGGDVDGKGIYASFWSGICAETYDKERKKVNSQNVCNKSTDHPHSIDEDRLMYGGEPEQSGGITFKLYRLSVERINTAFREF